MLFLLLLFSLLEGLATCFPGDATVLLEDGRETPVRELRVGDRAQCFRSDEGAFGFCEVLTFTTADPDGAADLLRVQYKDGVEGVDGAGGDTAFPHFVDMNEEHFVWALRLFTNAQPNPSTAEAEPYDLPFGAMFRARDVRIGDLLISPAVADADAAAAATAHSGTAAEAAKHAKYQLHEVVGISERHSDGNGHYSPFAEHGAMPVINGITVSTFSGKEGTPRHSWLLWYSLWGQEPNSTRGTTGTGEGGSGLPTGEDRLRTRGVRAADLKASSWVYASGRDAFAGAVRDLLELLWRRDGVVVDFAAVMDHIGALAAVGVRITARETMEILAAHASLPSAGDDVGMAGHRHRHHSVRRNNEIDDTSGSPQW
ncbi:unnamed protein product [Phaeothamnion confervicola]